MKSNDYVKEPRFHVGAFFDWNRLTVRRRRFISFVVCWLLNVIFALDILANGGYFDSANGRVGPSTSIRPSDLPSEGGPNKLDVRLLCWISFPFASRDKENSIRKTWGKRCDKLIFVANSPLEMTGHRTEADQSDPAGAAGVVRLFARSTLDVLKQLHDHHSNDSDWFLKAGAGTYVVVDQLKSMLSNLNPAAPSYLAATGNDAEMIGDAYVLSRESVGRLVRQFRRRHPDGRPMGCDLKTAPASSRCLDRLGLVSESTQDEMGCERFLGESLAKELTNNNEADGSGTRRCISEKVVIFSRLGDRDFDFYEHLLYRLKLPPSVRKAPFANSLH